MRNEVIATKKITLEDGNKCDIKYNLIYPEKRGRNIVYGIELEKFQDRVLKDLEYVRAVSKNRRTVVDLLKKLSVFEVTPATLINILDDILYC